MLVRAATRGDGATGEDVTANLRTIRAVPLASARRGAEAARGARRGVHAAGRASSGSTHARSARRASSSSIRATRRPGSLRQLDPRITASRPLDVFFYGVGRSGEGRGCRRRTSDCWSAARLGPAHLATGAAVVQRRRRAVSPTTTSSATRAELPYQIDGVVYKVDERAAAGAARLRVARAALGDRAQVPGRGGADGRCATSNSRSAAPAR